MTSVEPIAIVALVVLVAVAAVVNGTIGFGFALLAVNALALIFGARSGVIIMSILAPIVSGLQVWHHRDRRALTGRLRAMIAAGLVGSFIGTQLLVILPPAAISLALGLFTIWYVIDALRTARPPLSHATQRWLGPIAGLVGGTTNGALGASGPVFGTYLTAIGLRSADFAFAISMTFFTLSLARIGLLAALDQYTWLLVAVGLGLAVPSVAAKRVGLWLKGRVPDAILYRAVLVVLFMAGLNLLWRAALAITAAPVAAG
ncbi:MAG: sulfite exporter TauE/SafE family protein [Candidatus Limnocylindrales bacterium]